MSQVYSLLTTCKPSQDKVKFLASNELVQCCMFNHWPCVLLNREDELPESDSSKKEIEQVAPNSRLPRPILRDFIGVTEADWLIIVNSDVWIVADWDAILSALDKRDIHFASSRRWDLPENVKVSEFCNNKKLPLSKLREVSKRQSMRTLDVFVVRKKALEMAVMLNPEIGELIPGTVGFDNNLLGLIAGITKTADISPLIDIFHTNHEPFRKVFYRNHLVNFKQQSSFIEKRHQQRTLMTTRGCLTWVDYRFEAVGDSFFAVKNNFRWIRYYLESVRVKLVNKLDNQIFKVNKALFDFIKSWSRLSPSVCMLMGVVVVYPVPRSFPRSASSIEFEDAVRNLVNDMVDKWKCHLLSKYGV